MYLNEPAAPELAPKSLWAWLGSGNVGDSLWCATVAWDWLGFTTWITSERLSSWHWLMSCREIWFCMVLVCWCVLLGLVTAFSWTKEGSESQFSAWRHGEDGRGTALCRAWLLRTMLGLLRRHALRYRLLCVVGGTAIYGSCLVLTTQSVLVVSGKFSSFWRNKRADLVYFTTYSIGF